MARYTGPKTKIARKFGEPIFGPDKYFEKKNYPPGQHGLAKKRKKASEYGIQLAEKQKVKYMYGILERQFRNLFEKAAKAAIKADNEKLMEYFNDFYEISQDPAKYDENVIKAKIAPKIPEIINAISITNWPCSIVMPFICITRTA